MNTGLSFQLLLCDAGERVSYMKLYDLIYIKPLFVLKVYDHINLDLAEKVLAELTSHPDWNSTPYLFADCSKSVFEKQEIDEAAELSEKTLEYLGKENAACISVVSHDIYSGGILRFWSTVVSDSSQVKTKVFSDYDAAKKWILSRC